MTESARQADANANADTQVADDEPIVEGDDAEVTVETGGDQRLGGGRDTTAAADGKDTGAEPAKLSHNRARRLRQQRAQERLRSENEQLRAQVDQLSRGQQEIIQRLSGNEGATIQTQLADVDGKLQQATLIMSKAARSSAPTAEQDFADAVTIRDQLLEAKRNLTLAQQYQHQRAQQREMPAAPTPRGTSPKDRYVARFVANHADWYDPQLGNRESKLADRISSMLDTEGELDPNSKEYWDELDRRVHEHPQLAHLFDEGAGADEADDDDESAPVRREAPKVNGNAGAPQRAAGGPRMAVGGRERPLKRGEVTIPRELRDGMEEAGIWGNKEARNRVIADYRRNLRAQNVK